MFTVPTEIPVTMPVAGSTVARVVSVELQYPPATVLASVIVNPIQTFEGPVDAVVAATVTCFVLLHPDASVYVIVATPLLIPLTIPLVSTVTIAALLLVQVPPLTVLYKLVVLPAHNVAVPVMAAGVAPTVIFVVAVALVQLLVMV